MIIAECLRLPPSFHGDDHGFGAGLRSTGLAVVGLDTTTGTPPLLVEVAVFHLAGPVITGGPFGFWVQPDAPLAQVRRDARQDVWRAPPWAKVAEHVIDTLVGRVLVLHNPDRLWGCGHPPTTARSDSRSEAIVASTAVGSYPQCAMQLAHRSSLPRP